MELMDFVIKLLKMHVRYMKNNIVLLNQLTINFIIVYIVLIILIHQ